MGKTKAPCVFVLPPGLKTPVHSAHLVSSFSADLLDTLMLSAS